MTEKSKEKKQDAEAKQRQDDVDKQQAAIRKDVKRSKSNVRKGGVKFVDAPAVDQNKETEKEQGK